jgi:O-antigen/teichoic acid export membrane protein
MAPKLGAHALTARTIHGAAFLGGQMAVGKVAGFVGQVVLSWLLQPADFGIVGLAYTIAAFAGLIQQIGLAEFLVRRRRIDLWFEPAMFLAVGLAACSAIVMVVGAPFGAWLYGEPRIVGLLLVLAMGLPFSASSRVLTASLQAGMRFRAIAVTQSLLAVLNPTLSIAFALLGFGAYSFVLPIPMTEAARAVILWSLARPRMRWKPQPNLWRYFVPTSGLVLLANVCAMVGSQGDYVLLGIFQTNQTVGLYFFGFILSTQLIGFVRGTMSGVLFPVFSSIRSDPLRLRSAFVRAVNVTSVVIMPLGILQAVVADSVIRLLFAEKWIPAIPIIQLLSISMALHCVAEPCVPLLQAQGRFRDMFRYYLIWNSGILPLLALAAKFGDGTSVAAAVATYYAVASPIFFWAVTRNLGIRSKDIVRSYALPGLASCLSAAIFWGLAALLKLPGIVQIILLPLTFCPCYIGLISVLAPVETKEVWTLIREYFAKRIVPLRSADAPGGSGMEMHDPF